MSVVVKRRTAPVERISAGTENASWNGNTVEFTPTVGVAAGGAHTLQVQTRTVEGRAYGPLAHVDPADARDLAAALVEWADVVDAVDAS